tara:strand:+ start:1957 stop:2541 length:585 start_codon:yes stop_codon:yes gene_type:complete
MENNNFEKSAFRKGFNIAAGAISGGVAITQSFVGGTLAINFASNDFSGLSDYLFNDTLLPYLALGVVAAGSLIGSIAGGEVARRPVPEGDKLSIRDVANNAMTATRDSAIIGGIVGASIGVLTAAVGKVAGYDTSVVLQAASIFGMGGAAVGSGVGTAASLMGQNNLNFGEEKPTETPTRNSTPAMSTISTLRR